MKASERLRELEETIMRGDGPYSGREALVGALPLIADCIEGIEKMRDRLDCPDYLREPLDALKEALDGSS